MLSSYRALLGRDRARSLAVACGLGWLSFSGYGLAIILAVHAGTHSFAEAGAAVAAFSVGSGLLAPSRGRSIDRRGPRALGYLAVGHLLGSGLLLIGCSGGHRAWLVFPGAALAGTFAPPIIATARSMWTDVAGPDLARTGHALNAALADAAQIASPALTGVLALLVSPSAALATLVVGAATAAWLLAGRDRPTKSRSSVPVAHRVWGVLRESAGLRTILACDFAIGGWLGGLEVTVIAVAASAGTPELGALPLASSAVGSIAVSLWSGTHRSSQSAGSRYVMGSVMVAAVLPLTLLAQSVGPIAAILVLALGSRGAPRSRDRGLHLANDQPGGGNGSRCRRGGSSSADRFDRRPAARDRVCGAGKCHRAGAQERPPLACRLARGVGGTRRRTANRARPGRLISPRSRSRPGSCRCGRGALPATRRGIRRPQSPASSAPPSAPAPGGRRE